MSLNPSLPDFTQRAIAALQCAQTVTTAKARAYPSPFSPGQPYTVQCGPVPMRTYRFPSAPLAVAFLRSL